MTRLAAADKGGGGGGEREGEGERKRTSGIAVPLSAASLTFLLEAVWADLVVVVAVTATCALPACSGIHALCGVRAPCGDSEPMLRCLDPSQMGRW